MHHHLRLRHREDFARLRETGRVWRHPFLILSVAPNQLDHNRYAFVAGRKIGSAVVRNRVRRQLREIVRHLHPHLVPGHDMMFIMREPIAAQTFQAINRAVVEVVRRAGLWVSPAGESVP